MIIHRNYKCGALAKSLQDNLLWGSCQDAGAAWCKRLSPWGITAPIMLCISDYSSSVTLFTASTFSFTLAGQSTYYVRLSNTVINCVPFLFFLCFIFLAFFKRLIPLTVVFPHFRILFHIVSTGCI